MTSVCVYFRYFDLPLFSLSLWRRLERTKQKEVLWKKKNELKRIKRTMLCNYSICLGLLFFLKLIFFAWIPCRLRILLSDLSADVNVNRKRKGHFVCLGLFRKRFTFQRRIFSYPESERVFSRRRMKKRGFEMLIEREAIQKQAQAQHGWVYFTVKC